jgi:signal-transduction protein with cAMP-binding, CBS, and nucleotidyltransferase domain
MRHSGHYETGAVTVTPETKVVEVADRMDLHGVGTVVVVDGERRPLGIVTDRDLMRRVVAPHRDAEKTLASDVMTPDPVTGEVDEPLERVLARMRERKVRRLPILRDGRVVGLVALDDVICELGRELSEVREALRAEVIGARRSAPRRRRRERVESAFEELRSEVAQAGTNALEWIEREVGALRKRLGG